MRNHREQLRDYLRRGFAACRLERCGAPARVISAVWIAAGGPTALAQQPERLLPGGAIQTKIEQRTSPLAPLRPTPEERPAPGRVDERPPGAPGRTDRIWCAVVLASNPEKPKPPAPELAQIAEKISHFFGYRQIELIGSAAKPIDEYTDRWLVPCQDFWLKVASKRDLDSAVCTEDIQLYSNRRRILGTTIRLGPDSPVFINGPLHARGQVLIILQLQP